MYGATRAGYSRYVAIGDSQTEGLWDGNDAIGLVGFADRLAVMIDSIYPGLEYANLAIRGKLVAFAMSSYLVAVCIGMNDVIQLGRGFTRALTDL